MKYLAIIIGALLIGYGIYSITHTHYDSAVGAVSFPASLDTFTNPTATTRTNVVSHAGQHSDANDAIEALQTKVGADGSPTTTTHTYKLSGVTGSDLACSLTGTETLTNKTLTSPNLTGANSTTTSLWGTSLMTGTQTLVGTTTFTLNGNPFSVDLGSDATGDVYYRNASGLFTRLPVGSDGEVLKLASGIPSWAADSISGGIKVRAVKSSTQTLTTSSPVKITFENEDFDTGSDFSGSTFTTPENGYYIISSRLNQDNNRAAQVYIYVNGAASSTINTNSTNVLDHYISDTLFLEANDTVEIYAENIPGTSSLVISSGTTTTFFSVNQL